ncbi:unnamed protein product [Moneuplotes crassus]|uniref:Uncharacterized protein n=1 Tax=Euplotes crassus TaxID=5936 RepID=A0AAD1XN34_EUPCR|nr:unnamed protein product [Moneuplotes crassus]
MKLVYTKKGLEFRKSLKSEIESEQMDGYTPIQPRKISSRLRLSSFLKEETGQKETGFKLPDFDNVNVELIQTAKGEIKEKPLPLVNELETKEERMSRFYLNDRNSSKLQHILKDIPKTLHKTASKEMILPPKGPLQTSSFLDIIGKVESPSHWRFFQNKRQTMSGFFSPDDRSNPSNLTSTKRRYFSPEATHTSLSPSETKFPFNIEKIFRKHAKKEAQRQVISLALLRHRKMIENSKEIPEISEYYNRLEQELKPALADLDSHKRRLKQRIMKIHKDKYHKEWKSRQVFNRLAMTSYPTKKSGEV